MKVTREQAADNRERVLDAATQLFRARGFDGVGVAEVMQVAGLTHGGFYGQFDSKEALATEACARAFERSNARWTKAIDTRGAEGFAAVLKSYLSPQHRDNPGEGCTLAALSAEAGRRDSRLRQAFATGLASTIAVMTRAMPGRLMAARRRKALATMAGMVGAMVLARAVDDRALSDEILQATVAALSR